MAEVRLVRTLRNKKTGQTIKFIRRSKGKGKRRNPRRLARDRKTGRFIKNQA